MNLEQIAHETRQAIGGLLEAASLKAGQIVVVGCSTSEIAGHKIGTASNEKIAEVVLREILEPLKAKNIFLAVQCCEHLNRAIVLEEAAALQYGLEEVTVIPVPKAGGSLGAAAYKNFHKPVVVETIKAHAGLDIGDTFIGMHLKPVVIPVRLPLKQIGSAHLTLAYTRPKLIGGQRAVYCK
ncbi:TIGR01440 family protein [Bacillota bacterium LX-D]|nr:TIGR01440 family protein [Bacillota bacterium LX-D]